MNTTTSADGTRIAYTRIGHGPALILVDGALSHRGGSINDALAKSLADRFTVYTYDRRGRGESTDTTPYAVERESEDLAALIKEAGGEVFLYGCSSGAVLALEAVNRGLPVTRLALYEPPFVVDDSRKPVPPDYPARMEAAVKAGRRGQLVRMFMREGVGLPGAMAVMLSLMPKLKRVAHTLPYDNVVMAGRQAGQPLDGGWPGVTVPVLVADGGKSPAWMRAGVAATAGQLPTARYETLPGQTHIVKAGAIAPVLAGFFESSAD